MVSCKCWPPLFGFLQHFLELVEEKKTYVGFTSHSDGVDVTFYHLILSDVSRTWLPQS